MICLWANLTHDYALTIFSDPIMCSLFSSNTSAVSVGVNVQSSGANSSSRSSRQDHSTASSLATLATAASASTGSNAARPPSGSQAMVSGANAVSRGSRASRILHAVTNAGNLACIPRTKPFLHFSLCSD